MSKAQFVQQQMIPLPLPSRCAPSSANAAYVDEPVVANLREGGKLLGALFDFDHTAGGILLAVEGEPKPRTVPFADIKLLHLPTPRKWLLDKAAVEHGEDASPIKRQEFEVVFTDGDSLRGKTLGLRTDRNGIFLFPSPDPQHFTRIFIPTSFIKEYNVGPRLGEMLVEENLVSADQISSVLSSQEEQRNQKLGDYLRNEAVVTANELEKALERQKSAPNLKLGEILIGEKMISEMQLEGALAAQKQNRGKPLGQILIDQGLVNSQAIQQALARKLNIPFVDLAQFQIDVEAVDMIPQELARKHQIVPLYAYGDKLVVALENPMAWEPMEAIRFHTKRYVEPVMASAEEIARTIDILYSQEGAGEVSLEEYEIGPDDVEDQFEEEAAVSDNVVVKLVNKIIIDAHHQNASDIHIEPSSDRKTVVRIRKDGSLVSYLEVPAKLRGALVARIKIMAGLDISERRKPQDGKIDFRKFSKLKIELRVATIPTTGGQEDVVMRILAAGEPLPLIKLGLSEANNRRLKELVAKPYGLFFVCGPTGSGKTTTLHSILGHLNTVDTKIWTAEDPVEITQKGLRQVQVNAKIGLTFAAAMRAFLRADPDIIMVGEMRDKETTSMGVEASLTGHLVFSTLHTNSAPESIVRLLDMGMDPFNFADALLGILAQRLTKRFCPKCRTFYTASEEEMHELVLEYCHELIGVDDEPETIRAQVMEDWTTRFGEKDGSFRLAKADGCDDCGGTGFKGRIGIHELLAGTDAVKKLILEESQVSVLTAQALKEGMRTLKQDGIEKVLQGLTDIHQIRKVCIK